jgi:hypothetical protein
MIYSGPVDGQSQKWASTVGLLGRNSPKWALGRIFFCFCTKSEFFAAIKYYYQKEVQLPNDNQNSCSNKKVFYQRLEFFEHNY